MKKKILILFFLIIVIIIYEFPMKKTIATNKFYRLLDVENSIKQNNVYDLNVFKSFTPEYGYRFIFKVRNSNFEYSYTYKYAQNSWEKFYYDGNGHYLPLPNKKIILNK